MNRNPLIILVISALAAVLGCEDDTERISQVTKFRVLGVQADPPEVRPGDGTTFRVLFADPKGAGRKIEVLWFGCIGLLDPDEELTQGCRPLSAPHIGLFGEGGEAYEIASIPEDVLGEDELSTKATAFVIGCAGGSLELPDNLLDGESGLNFSDLCRGGDALVATKTVTVSREKSLNTNPRIETVILGEVSELTPVSVDGPANEAESYLCTQGDGCRDQVALEAFLSKSSFEQVTEDRFGRPETRDERVYLSWFITGGSFDRNRSGIADPPDPQAPSWGPFEATWFPPRQGGLFDLWVVAHDLRGGASWRHYVVEAVPPR